MLKVTSRGKLYYLLEFTTSKSIYIVYDPSTKRIERTRDIIFDERPSILGEDINKLDIPNKDFDENENDVINAPSTPYLSIFCED